MVIWFYYLQSNLADQKSKSEFFNELIGLPTGLWFPTNITGKTCSPILYWLLEHSFIIFQLLCGYLVCGFQPHYTDQKNQIR